jgi:hypothetical protein
VCFSNQVPQVTCTNIISVVQICRTNTVPLVSCVTTQVVDIDCFYKKVPVVDCTTNSDGTVTGCTNVWAVTRVCVTNLVPRLSCTTTGYTQVVRCENRTVRTPDCTTNGFIWVQVCTNDFGATPILRVRESIVGPVVANATCDETGTLLPSDAVLQATWYGDLRQPDWRGFHNGYFTISSGGTNIIAGSINGSNGVETHGDQCAACNHFEGTLRGSVWAAGPLQGARIQATYAGVLTDVKCPSDTLPQGAVQLAIDGVVVGPCPPPPVVTP